jgi:hypothetical protein
VLVTGPGGIGKSTLGHELEAAVVGERGLFLPATFDPYQRNVPYAALIEALRDLLADVLDRERSPASPSGGPAGRGAAEQRRAPGRALPALELVLGKQPPVVELPAPRPSSASPPPCSGFWPPSPAPSSRWCCSWTTCSGPTPPSLELLQRTALARQVGPLLLVGTCRRRRAGARARCCAW